MTDFRRETCYDRCKRKPGGDWFVQDMGLGDNIDSLRCSHGVKVRVYEHFFDGRSAVVNPGQSMDSYALKRVDLNDEISTVRIRYDDENV